MTTLQLFEADGRFVVANTYLLAFLVAFGLLAVGVKLLQKGHDHKALASEKLVLERWSIASGVAAVLALWIGIQLMLAIPAGFVPTVTVIPGIILLGSSIALVAVTKSRSYERAWAWVAFATALVLASDVYFFRFGHTHYAAYVVAASYLLLVWTLAGWLFSAERLRRHEANQTNAHSAWRAPVSTG